jgi:hypothetical protein
VGNHVWLYSVFVLIEALAVAMAPSPSPSKPCQPPFFVGTEVVLAPNSKALFCKKEFTTYHGLEAASPR